MKTVPRRCLCTRRVLVYFLIINVTCLGLVLLVLYDRVSNNQNHVHRAEFERWKRIRDDFDKYQKNEANKADTMKKTLRGRQMDAVLSFDEIGKTNITQENENVKKRIAAEQLRMDEAVKSADLPLDHIPPVPEFSDIDIVPYLSEDLISPYLVLPKHGNHVLYNQSIVILTPICDVEHLLEQFMNAIKNLTYPHTHISVYLGEDSSSDLTLNRAKLLAKDLVLNHGFRDAGAFHFNYTGGIHGDWTRIHSKENQLERRAHMAHARNDLLSLGMRKGHFDQVLWIDSDVKYLPSDLIQQLLFARADVVVTSCLYKEGRFKKLYDRNSWRETPTSIENQKTLPVDILLVEGYSHSSRIFLPDLKAEGRIVPLDGVGGCVLMVKAECHRKGLNFPEKIYKHHIETEGLAKMATNMGFSVRGLPWLEVFHNF
ncbi:uncharacterized protein LOC127837802 [Dreissena polymorpha]|uniref:Uncharacterized protein n=1 Tax=Dreissena polymorpha TaxID=45954 RepID=A0A9D4RXH0_DREPO|nr:uncharacterized protein LOC127837802 [Dreissena polymorpha]KAH3884609.1 hypothetical protein DPMN_008592 [Dreissena polymorpha]